ncbi:magnesium transporter [bacterium]|nr:magnesium transporter [bacterium]
MEDEIKIQNERLYSLFETGDLVHLREELAELHEADITNFLLSLDADESLAIFKLLETSKAGGVLYEMDSETAKDILSSMDDTMIAGIIDSIHPDEAADLIGYLRPKRMVKVLNKVSQKHRNILKEILEYPIDSAGGIMTTDVIRIKETDTVEQAIRKCKRGYPPDIPLFIYSIDDDGKLTGIVRSRSLLFADDNDRVSDIKDEEVYSVNINADQEEAANIVRKYDLLAIPVVDDDSVLKGIITSDDIFDVIRDEHTEDMLLMAGSSEKEPFTEPIYKKALQRLPWLIITLFGGLTGGSILKGFQSTLSKMVALSFFIPMVNALAGNVGIQSSTIIVRGIATGELQFKNALKNLFRELGVGMILGALLGLLAGFGVSLISGSYRLGIVVMTSMLLTMTFASINGFLIPLICDKLGIDPAIVSGPFVTTLNDIFGILIYLLCGVLLLQLG